MPPPIARPPHRLAHPGMRAVAVWPAWRCGSAFAGALRAESEAALQLRLDAGGELKGIERLALAAEFRHAPGFGPRRSREALQRGLGRFVTPPPTGADPLLVGQLHRGQEEVLKPVS